MTDFKDFIQQVKRANDIADVVGSYLELRPKGAALFARCPFHGEKTASFSVNRNMQIYHCFGCGESGDVIKFVQQYESCTLMEALEILAKRAGIKMPETREQAQDKQYQEKKRKRDEYFAICRDAAVFYFKNFYAPQGQIAREYMSGRGFDDATLKKFGIGYSPDRFSLVKFLQGKKHSDEDCVACGVLQRGRDGTVADALAGRLIVPIINVSGKVIAFGGRGLDERTISFGKYKNTGESPQFVKRNNLFALNVLKEQKQQSALKEVVMVEGYMDVIAMYQAGYKCAVASMGTSLTENQAKLLSRITDTVYICYDGDAAGQKATVRGLDILDSAGIEVRVMSVPENLDPDEYIKKYGAEAFGGLIKQALPLPDYKLRLLENAYPISSDNLTVRNNAMPKYVRGAIKMLRQLDDVRQTQYLSAVSIKTGYSQEYLRRKLHEEQPSSATEEQTDSLSPAEKAKFFVAACLLSNQEFATLAEKPYCESQFLSDLYDYIFRCYDRGEKPRTDMLYTVCPNGTKQQYEDIINVDFSPQQRQKNELYFRQCKSAIATENVRQKREQLLARLKQNPDDRQILEEIARLNEKI